MKKGRALGDWGNMGWGWKSDPEDPGVRSI